MDNIIAARIPATISATTMVPMFAVIQFIINSSFFPLNLQYSLFHFLFFYTYIFYISSVFLSRSLPLFNEKHIKHSQ